MELTSITIEEADKVSEDYCRDHFPRRFERAGQYRFREDRLRCIGAGILLDKVLGLHEQELTKGPYGKLYLPESPVGFNISHSGDYIVLAYGEGNIGVDIEKHFRRPVNVAKKVYTPEEIEWMGMDPEERFFRLWSMKESVIKALGKGFSLSPQSFCVLPAMEGKPVTVEDTVLYLQTVPVEGYSLCVCSDHPFSEKTPELHRLNII